MPGFTIASCWDEEKERAKEFAATFLDTGEVASSPEEMADKKKIDAAFIADCSGDGHDKLQLARPFIERRITQGTRSGSQQDEGSQYPSHNQ